MPIQAWRIQDDRVDFRGALNRREVLWLVDDPRLSVLQTTEPAPVSTWELLNDEFCPARPEVQLRVYSFSDTCDLSFTRRLTNARHFSADCLMDAANVEAIAEMPSLESLGVGVFNLESFSFLWQTTPFLKMLLLGGTRSNKPDLAPLSRFTALDELYLEGHTKNIEILAELQSLKDVTLRSISTPGVTFLRPLAQMWSLDVKLGGIKDFSALCEMANLIYLELWRINGLADLTFVSDLPGLQFLFLQSLPQVKALPSFGRLTHLRRILVSGLKGLLDVSSLEHAPALEEAIFTDLRHLPPESFLPLLRNPRLKRLSSWLGSRRMQARLEVLAREHSVEVVRSLGEFEFIGAVQKEQLDSSNS